MNPTDHSISTLQEIFTDNLLTDVYDPEGLADWCQRSYPTLKICQEFRRQLLDVIQHPGLISPKTYEAWTLDERFATQELLQSHLKDIWNMCFPDEAVE